MSVSREINTFEPFLIRACDVTDYPVPKQLNYLKNSYKQVDRSLEHHIKVIANAVQQRKVAIHLHYCRFVHFSLPISNYLNDTPEKKANSSTSS